MNLETELVGGWLSKMFHPLAAKIIQSITAQEAIVDFGNQRLDPNIKTNATTVRDFYHEHGWKRYLALDVNEEKDAIICDLNEPVNLGTEFQLVVNNGTSEHIFNQYMVFKNAHDLCEQDGHMLHILPFTTWINHGFFNYNPVYFRDLAAANNYEIVKFAIGDRWGSMRDLTNDPALFVEKDPTVLEGYIKEMKTTSLFNIVLLKKRNKCPFKSPFQGKYKADITDSNLQGKYL